MVNNLSRYRIILASGSPRRRELIADAGITYDLAPSYDVDEVYPDTIAPEDIPTYLAELKSAAYPEQLAQGEVLITADTVVIVDEKVLGKPHDRDDAVAMLALLSGRSHRVVTGVTLRDSSKMVSFSDSTTVYFRALTTQEIAYYVDNYKPYDKAGAYGIQEWIGYIGIERVEGSYYNVMGLPIHLLYTNLQQFMGE